MNCQKQNVGVMALEVQERDKKKSKFVLKETYNSIHNYKKHHKMTDVEKIKYRQDQYDCDGMCYLKTEGHNICGAIEICPETCKKEGFACGLIVISILLFIIGVIFIVVYIIIQMIINLL